MTFRCFFLIITVHLHLFAKDKRLKQINELLRVKGRAQGLEYSSLAFDAELGKGQYDNKKRLSQSHFYDTQYVSQYIVDSLKKEFSVIGGKIVRGPQKSRHTKSIYFLIKIYIFFLKII